jgi:hypothetical protein
VEVAQRRGLVEAQHALTEQLEHREEPRHRGDHVGVGGQRPERGAPLASQPVDDEMGLLAHAHPGSVQVGQREHRHRLGFEGGRGEQREVVGADRDDHFRQQLGEPRLQHHRAGMAELLLGQPGGDQRSDLLERAVLHEPGEQEVAGLEQREVVLVLDVALRQQPSRLEVEQRGRDQQELGGLFEIVAEVLDVADELVGDLRQRHLGDVELMLGDQREQQVEWALEDTEADREAGCRGCRVLDRILEGCVERARRGSHDALSRWAISLSVPRVSRSPSAIARAARTRRPRSTLRPRSPRSLSLACSMASSSSDVR